MGSLDAHVSRGVQVTSSWPEVLKLMGIHQGGTLAAPGICASLPPSPQLCTPSIVNGLCNSSNKFF